MLQYRPPLHVHVVFCDTHPNGKDWAKELARWFTGERDDYSCPEARLPVFVWHGTRAQPPLDVPWEEAQRTALILLVDDGLVGAWRGWAAKQAAAKRPCDLLLPCTITENFVNLGPAYRDVQAMRLDRVQAEDSAFQEKARRADLMLYATRALADWFAQRGAGARQTRLFISHAKGKHQNVSGRDLAVALQAFVRQRPAGATFFDEVGISAGDDFEAQLMRGLDGATIVVLLTDLFSTRYWCRWEVATAKGMQRPMLVVDALVQGERTSLSYVGNARTIRWDPSTKDDSAMHRMIVAAALLEQLRFERDAAMLAVVKELAAPETDAVTMARPVELLTLPPVREGGARTLVLHPDPALPTFELGMIRRHRPDVDFASATQALSGSYAGAAPLRGKRIAISISNGTDTEIAANGLRTELLERLWTDVATHLITAGAELAYGGDLRQKGYTDQLLDLVKGAADAGRPPPPNVVHWYAGWPVASAVSQQQEASFPEAFVFHRHELPRELDPARFPEAPPPNDGDPEHHFAWTLSLRDMRRAMARDCHARVLVGGQVRSVSPWPGLLEELEAFLVLEKPVFLIGAFGGMTRVLIEALQGSVPEELTQEFQDDRGDRTPLRLFYEARAGAAGFEDVPRIDLAGRLAKLGQRGIAGLRNGLSLEENQRLFVTRDITEMIVLVLRGLRASLR